MGSNREKSNIAIAILEHIQWATFILTFITILLLYKITLWIHNNHSNSIGYLCTKNPVLNAIVFKFTDIRI